MSSAAVARAGEATAAATLGVSFHGLDHFDQRTANGGNQFSVEPPDQGLCVGNGFVMETVNDVIQVFDTSGNPLTDVVDQNTFYGYAPGHQPDHGQVRAVRDRSVLPLRRRREPLVPRRADAGDEEEHR